MKKIVFILIIGSNALDSLPTRTITGYPEP